MLFQVAFGPRLRLRNPAFVESSKPRDPELSSHAMGPPNYHKLRGLSKTTGVNNDVGGGGRGSSMMKPLRP